MEAMFGLIGGVVQAAGTIAAGKAANEQAKFEAAQLEIKGQEERAAAQREAREGQRTGRYAVSRQRALSASGGLGATDPSIMDLSADTWVRALYQGKMVKYGGEERKRGLYAQAEARRYEGKVALQQSKMAAFGSILGAAGGLFGSYGGGGPSGGSPSYAYG